ncbi:MAG: Cu(I)-responsive transcriptional regulator [Myxococcota bacterium]
MSERFAIGELARRTGVSAKTIRYYEDSGLLEAPQRGRNGYRLYDEQAVHVLRFVKRARDLGFSVADVSDLLALWSDDSRESAAVKQLATRHLAEVDRKIAELQGLRDTLGELVARCHGDDRPDCPILDSLGPDDA